MIAENIIPCVEDIVSCVLGDYSLKVIKEVPLSNFTFSKRIKDMSCRIEYELIKQMKSSQGFVM
jgi:hypothetical protein